MDGFYFFILLLSIFWSILCVILFFKVWGMTNDVRELKNYFIRHQQTTTEEGEVIPQKTGETYQGFAVGETVIAKRTGEKMIIQRVTEVGKFCCYSTDGSDFLGYFFAKDLSHLN